MIQQMVYRGTDRGYRTVALSKSLKDSALLQQMERLCRMPGSGWVNQSDPCPVFFRCIVGEGVAVGRTIKNPGDTRNRNLTHLLYVPKEDFAAFDECAIPPELFFDDLPVTREQEELQALDCREVLRPLSSLNAAILPANQPEKLALFMQALRLNALGGIKYGFNGICIRLKQMEYPDSLRIYAFLEALLRAYTGAGARFVGYRTLWNVPENNVMFPVFFTTEKLMPDPDLLNGSRFVLFNSDGSVSFPRGMELKCHPLELRVAEALLSGNPDALDQIKQVIKRDNARKEELREKAEAERKRQAEEAERKRRAEEAERRRAIELAERTQRLRSAQERAQDNLPNVIGIYDNKLWQRIREDVLNDRKDLALNALTAYKTREDLTDARRLGAACLLLYQITGEIGRSGEQTSQIWNSYLSVGIETMKWVYNTVFQREWINAMEQRKGQRDVQNARDCLYYSLIMVGCAGFNVSDILDPMDEACARRAFQLYGKKLNSGAARDLVCGRALFSVYHQMIYNDYRGCINQANKLRDCWGKPAVDEVVSRLLFVGNQLLSEVKSTQERAFQCGTIACFYALKMGSDDHTVNERINRIVKKNAYVKKNFENEYEKIRRRIFRK